MNRHRWRKALPLLLALFVMLGAVLRAYAAVSPAGGQSGGTYFTDDDNWGGGPLGIENADGDPNLYLNRTITTEYPIEFKIINVDKLPAKSAHLLIRAYDVDEYIFGSTSTSIGEWDRVYFSSTPSDIALCAP